MQGSPALSHMKGNQLAAVSILVPPLWGSKRATASGGDKALIDS